MTNKDTKNIPQLTKRQSETKNRFKKYAVGVKLLMDFFDLGFDSFNALKSIIKFYYPEIDEVKLKRFWNCYGIDDEVLESLKVVFHNIKTEQDEKKSTKN